MTNREMLNSTSYKTYLAFATRATTPKKARKFKKHASPSKKKTFVAIEEPAEKPTKKPAARRQPIGSSSERAGLEPEVPDEQKGKPTNTSEGTGLISGVPDVSKVDFSKSKYESWEDIDDDNDDDDQQSDAEQNMFDNLRKSDDEEETHEDELVHTPKTYVHTNDENVDYEEYERINREMYDDMNMELKDAEPADKGKGDEEMTNAEKVDDENENVNQEVASDQVNDDAQETVTASLATQKT
nr:hypothetical protein [Tanacetum cinerariifolium]